MRGILVLLKKVRRYFSAKVVIPTGGNMNRAQDFLVLNITPREG